MSFESERYIKHALGLNALLLWAKKWKNVDPHLRIHDHQIILGPLTAQRFGYGIPKRAQNGSIVGARRFGSVPFLAWQPEEKQWAELLIWKQAWVDEVQNMIHLVAGKTIGDNQMLPDMLGCILSIPVDIPEKIKWPEQRGWLDFRGLWWDEDLAQTQELAAWTKEQWDEWRAEHHQETFDVAPSGLGRSKLASRVKPKPASMSDSMKTESDSSVLLAKARVESGSPFVSLKVQFWSGKDIQEILPSSDRTRGLSFEELIQKRIDETNYDAPLEFEGSVPQLGSFGDLLKPFESSQVEVPQADDIFRPKK